MALLVLQSDHTESARVTSVLFTDSVPFSVFGICCHSHSHPTPHTLLHTCPSTYLLFKCPISGQMFLPLEVFPRVFQHIQMFLFHYCAVCMYYHLHNTTSGGINTFESVSYLFFVFLEERDNLKFIVFVSTTQVTLWSGTALLQFCGNREFQNPFCSSSWLTEILIPNPAISGAP